MGEVKSLQRFIRTNKEYHSIGYYRKEKVLKKSIRANYYAVKLYKNSKGTNMPIHRLVAIAFIKNIENKKCINHKDGNKLNNNVENLEWCTHSENTIHSFNKGLQKITEKQIKNSKELYKKAIKKTSKKVNQYDLQGNFIKEWTSISEANRYYGKTKTKINDVCKGKCKHSMGYIWKYAD